MRHLDKTKLVMVRLTPAQRRKLADAAALESRRRGERVAPATLAREVIMAAVDLIVVGAHQQPTAA